jgi:aldehyde dehydrogenase (NAD+)
MNAPERRWPAVNVPARHFIGNRFVEAGDGRTLPMIDPSDGAPFAAIARGNAADVDAAVQAARRARDGAWGKLAPAERGRRLAALSRAIAEHADELALLEARDCGKPLAQARADAAACAG